MAVPTPDLQTREAWLTGFGLALIAVIAVFVVLWYGSNETSAAGILGATIPAIASIVSAVIGVAMGSKTGSAAGKQIGDAKTTAAKSAIASAKVVVDGAKATRIAALTAGGKSAPPTDEVTHSLDSASMALDAVLKSL